MRKKRIWHLVGILILAVIIFVTIQALGGYLIEQISSFNGSMADELRVEVVEKTILRLESMEYYTCQVGLFSDVALAQSIINNFAQAGYRVYPSANQPYRLYYRADHHSDH